MSEWWTYRAADFLMYSARTWYRIIEQYNTALWPLQLVMLLLGLVVIILSVRPPPWHGRAIGGILAFLWLWVAIAFLWQRFATISTAGNWFAGAFAVQAILLAWTALVRNSLSFGMRGSPGWLGLGFLLIAVLFYPFIPVVAGRGVAQAEVLGMMPDPTVLATIGALILARGHWRRRLLVIPVFWCVLSGAMLWALRQETG
jgi:hypothetical protein